MGIDKVVMVEETEYDDVVTCKHSYSKNVTPHTLLTSNHNKKKTVKKTSLRAVSSNARRFPEKFVDLVPLKFPDKKNASTEKKLSSKKSQKKYVLVPEPTQERSKNQLSRNGVTYQLLNLVWLKQISKRLGCEAHFDYTFCLSNVLFGYLYMLVMYSKMPHDT